MSNDNNAAVIRIEPIDLKAHVTAVVDQIIAENPEAQWATADVAINARMMGGATVTAVRANGHSCNIYNAPETYDFLARTIDTMLDSAVNAGGEAVAETEVTG